MATMAVPTRTALRAAVVPMQGKDVTVQLAVWSSLTRLCACSSLAPVPAVQHRLLR